MQHAPRRLSPNSTLLVLIILLTLLVPMTSLALPSGPPTVTTAAATAVGTTTATLHGTVNANGDSTVVTFEYGTSSAFGNTMTADQSPATGATDTAVSATIASLAPNMTYHFRVVGVNVNGTSHASEMTFTTAGSTTTLLASPNPSSYGQSVIITATVTSGAGTPTGTVMFDDGGVSLGSSTLDGSGQATLSTSVLSPGMHVLGAAYAGEGDFLASTAVGYTQTVTCASTITVVNDHDAGPGSLRRALTDVCPGGTIDFDLSYPATITLTTGELTRTSAVTINGPGAEHLAVSGAQASRVLTASQPITITGLTIRDGATTLLGGGIYAASSLTLSNCNLISNTADLAGGGIYALGDVSLRACSVISNASPAGAGGGILVDDLAPLDAEALREGPASLQGLLVDLIFGGNTLSISDSHFTANTAALVGGAVLAPHVVVTHSQFISNTAQTHFAGAVLAYGTATISESKFQGNQAATDSGALEVGAWLIMTNTQFIDNHALAGDGGALLITGLDIVSPTSSSSSLRGTTTSRWEPRERARRTQVAALATDSLDRVYGLSQIANSRFVGNSSDGIGGGICSDPFTGLVMEGVTLINNSAVVGGGGAAIASMAIISGTQFIGNQATDGYGVGGGLLMGVLSQVTPAATLAGYPDVADPFTSAVISTRFEGNDSRGMGGGIYCEPLLVPSVTDSPGIKDILQVDALVVITNTSIVSNTTTYGGAGLTSDAVNMAIIDSTVAGNVTQGVMIGEDEYGTGGGLQLMDMAQVELTNVTIADNQAIGKNDDGGGGIMIYDFAGALTRVHLKHVTIVGNDTTSTSDWGTGGGGISMDGGMLVMTNTIVAGNTSAAGSPDIAGRLASHGGNLIGNGDSALIQTVGGDLIGNSANPQPALTGRLGNYGGNTETIPLLPGSLAINGGGSLGRVSVDQRGIARDVFVDIGAFESRGFAISSAVGTPQSQAILAQFASPLVASITSAYGEPVDGGQVGYRAPTIGPSAALAPNGLATIQAGQASVLATANGLVGSYLVEATIPRGVPIQALSAGQNSAQFDLTNLPVSGQAWLDGGPKTLCPGFNVYYSMVVTNTSPLATMYGLAVTGTVPAGTAFYGDAAPAGSVYNAGTGEVVWHMPPIAAGETAHLEWTVHTLTTIADGTVITGTASWSSQTLAGGTQTMTVTVDDTNCQPPPPADLTITGGVYGGGLQATQRLADGHAIAGAIVTATTCLPGDWVAITDANGQYQITIPGQTAARCDAVTLDVTAQGYGATTGTWTVADLRSNPVRDFWLDPRMYVWLPLGFK